MAKGGSVRVGLLDERGRSIRGRSIKDCLPIVGNSLSMLVKCKGGSAVGLRSDKPTRLQVEMALAEVCSFQIMKQ